jgi:hypothetical protein
MPATGGDNDPFFDAVRILLLLEAASRPLDSPLSPELPRDAVAVLSGEGRLQKLDFWLRYPDYLADELLSDYETSREAFLLDLAGRILDSEEPELRSIPMLRYKFGAYEPLDMALSILVSEGLVARDPLIAGRRIRRNTYYLTALGREIARSAVTEYPVLAWYGDRIRVVAALADGTGLTGTALRKRQYLQRDYAGTGLNEEIGSIAERARKRLDALRAEPGSAA